MHIENNQDVQTLQSLLFPISPRSPRRIASDGYLSNFLLKRSIYEQQNDVDLSKTKELREIYAKESNCTSQPPRWPTECQV